MISMDISVLFSPAPLLIQHSPFRKRRDILANPCGSQHWSSVTLATNQQDRTAWHPGISLSPFLTDQFMREAGSIWRNSRPVLGAFWLGSGGVGFLLVHHRLHPEYNSSLWITVRVSSQSELSGLVPVTSTPLNGKPSGQSYPGWDTETTPTKECSERTCHTMSWMQKLPSESGPTAPCPTHEDNAHHE